MRFGANGGKTRRSRCVLMAPSQAWLRGPSGPAPLRARRTHPWPRQGPPLALCGSGPGSQPRSLPGLSGLPPGTADGPRGRWAPSPRSRQGRAAGLRAEGRPSPLRPARRQAAPSHPAAGGSPGGPPPGSPRLPEEKEPAAGSRGCQGATPASGLLPRGRCRGRRGGRAPRRCPGNRRLPRPAPPKPRSPPRPSSGSPPGGTAAPSPSPPLPAGGKAAGRAGGRRGNQAAGLRRRAASSGARRRPAAGWAQPGARAAPAGRAAVFGAGGGG